MINQIEAIIINKGVRYKDFVIAFILIIAALITGSYFMVAGVSGVYLDDGIYVSTAKSIASNQGYRLINLPGAPFQTKYPPLYPLILAGLWKIWPDFPSNLLAMQWVTLFMAAMSVGFSYYYLSVYGYATREIALLAGILTVTSHYFLYYSTLTLSEMPFAFLLCLALVSLEKFVRNSSNRAYEKIFLTVILTLPFLTRSIGIVLIPVALILLFLNHRPLWSISIGCAFIVLGWIVWTNLQLRTEQPVINYYTSYNDWWLRVIEIGSQVQIIIFNLVFLLNNIIVSGVSSFSRLLSWVPNHWLLITLLGTPVLTGIFSGVRQWQILPCFLAVYLLVIIIWPWPPPRRVIPVLMFLLVYLLNETWAIFKRIKGEITRKVIAGVAGVLLIVGNLWETNQVASFNHKMHYPSMLTSANQPVAWSSFLHMFDWIKTNTNTTDIIASPFDSMIFLYTGRRGFRPFIMLPTSLFYGKSTPAHDTANEFLDILKNNQASYLIHVPMLHFAEEKPYGNIVEEIQREHAGVLRLVYKGDDARFQLFKISKQ